MLPQNLVYKNELNREYVITLARNDETPWWWSEKIETFRSGFKCFKLKLYRCICWLIVEVKCVKFVYARHKWVRVSSGFVLPPWFIASVTCYCLNSTEFITSFIEWNFEAHRKTILGLTPLYSLKSASYFVNPRFISQPGNILIGCTYPRKKKKSQ